MPTVITVCLLACAPTERNKRLQYVDLSGRALGIGLTTDIAVGLIECDGPDTDIVSDVRDECENPLELAPSSFRFEVLGGTANLVASRKGSPCREGCNVIATVEGVRPGSMTLRAQLDELPALDIELDVAAVRSTRVGFWLPFQLGANVRRDFDVETSVAFAGGIEGIFQQHSSEERSNGEFPEEGLLRGSTEFVVLSGDIDIFGSSSIMLPEVPGTVEIGTTLGGAFAIDVVDATSVATLLIVDYFDFSRFGGPIQLLVGDVAAVGIAPLTEAGELIRGTTFPPSCTDAEPTFACRGFSNSFDSLLTTAIEGRAPGTAELVFTLGDATTSMLVNVQ